MSNRTQAQYRAIMEGVKMDEKLLGNYLDKADAMLDEATTLTERALILQIKLQARQARQLTRIADQVSGYLAATVTDSPPVTDDDFIELPDSEGNPHHFHRHDLTSYRDGWFHYKPMGGIRTPLTAKEIKAIVETTTPAPDVPTDGLVEGMMEAMKKIPLGRLWCGQCESYDHECGCDPNIAERTRRKFFAVHEKAVGK